MKKIENWEMLEDNKILINNKIIRTIKKNISDIKYIIYDKKEYTLQELDNINYFNEYHKKLKEDK